MRKTRVPNFRKSGSNCETCDHYRMNDNACAKYHFVFNRRDPAEYVCDSHSNKNPPMFRTADTCENCEYLNSKGDRVYTCDPHEFILPQNISEVSCDDWRKRL